jgi:hypothetical protein
MMRHINSLLAAIVLLWLATWAAGRAWAIELDALVPRDAGLTVEIRHLADDTRQFQGGELFRRLKAFPAFEKWFAEHGQELAKSARQLHTVLGASIEELGTKLLGRQVLVAVFPAEEMGREGTALLLVRTDEPKLLESVVERVVKGQKQAGKWKETRSITHGDRTYQVQVLQAGPGSAFVAVLDDEAGSALGLMTTDEKILDRVLEAHARRDADHESLATLPTYKTAMSRLAPDVTIRAFLSPRPWDKLLSSTFLSDQPTPTTKLSMLSTWLASQYAVASIDLKRDLAIEAYWHCDSSALPEIVRKVLESGSGRSNLLDRAPASALAAAVGRVDLGRLVRTLFLPTSASQSRGLLRLPKHDLGSAVVFALASGLGPDAGAFLVPSRPATNEAENIWPLEWVVGVETQPIDDGEKQTTLAESLEPLVRMALSLAVADDASRHKEASDTTKPAARIETIDIDERKVTSIWGLPKMGTDRPLVYSVAAGHVWAATSIETLRPLVVPPKDVDSEKSSLAQSPRLRKLLSPRVGDPSDLVFIDLVGLRKLFDSSPRAVDGLAALKRLDRSAAERSWRDLQAVLQLANAVVAEAKIEASGVSLAIRVSAE